MSGRLLLSGAPGSGKTRRLCDRFVSLVRDGYDPERIGMFVLTRRAARDARERIGAALARSVPGLPVVTPHGYAFGLLKRRAAELGYDDEPVILSAADQYALVRELLRGEDPAAWPRHGHLLDVRGFARQVSDFVLRAQERLLEPEDLPAGDEVAAFYERYLQVQSLHGRTDFAGLLTQAVVLLERGVGPGDRFDHVLVDDYQDATPALAAILAALAPHAETVTVAADPDGSVFSFRGGSAEPLRDIERTLPGIERAALDGTTRSGITEARLYGHAGEMAEAIATELLRSRVSDDVPWNRMAVVLRRYGGSLPILRHALTRHGVPHVVVGEASAIASEPAVAPLLDLVRYALRPELRDDLLEPVLVAAVRLDPHGLRALRRHARLGRRSLRALVEDPHAELPDHLAAATARLRGLISVVETHRDGDPAALFFELWSRLPSGAEMVAAERHRDLDALAALGDILRRFAGSRPNATFADWLDVVEAADFGPDPWVPPEERRPAAVRVTTAHRAHGLELDVVCVAGCVEGEFPAAAPAARLVDLDGLLAPRPARDRIADHLAEEARLFRLATTRARVKTVLFAERSSSSTRPRTPSRYAERAGVAWIEPVGAQPAVSLRTLQSSLRRRATDASQAEPDRLAAAAALAEIGADLGSWWGRRDWTDPGVALYGEEMPTSYSRLSTLENCGLQYLYEVEMGLDPAPTHQMWVGVLIHDIIDRAQRGEIPRTLESVLAALDEGWDPDVFPSRAIETRRRQDCREMLTRWIAQEKEEVVHSEVSFTYPLDGALIRGKIDAIFRMDNGHVRIVDYKTSRFPPPQKGIKDNLQLAAYYLATVLDPELAKIGKTGYMQLAFPAKEARDGDGYEVRGTNVRPGYREWAEDKLRELIGRVRAENFAPSPEADCQWCEFKTICPRWPQGADAGRGSI